MRHHYKTLFSLFDDQDRRGFGLFITVTFFAGALEVIGIGSIMPFIGLLLQPDLIETNQVLSRLYETVNATSQHQFMIFMGLLTIVLIVSGGLIGIFAIRSQLKLTHLIGHKWATRLLSSYLNHPYQFYLDNNTNTLKAAVLSEVDRTVSSILIPSAVLISRGIIILIIFVLLLLVNPLITLLLLFVTGSVYSSLLIYFRHKMKAKGQEAVAHNKTRYQTTNEAFSSIRDILLHHNSGYFTEKFQAASERYATIQAYSLYHGQIPRFVIEMTGFAALIGLTLYLVAYGENHGSAVIPLIALFAASGYKVLPAAQSMYAAINSIRFNTAALTIIAKGLQDSNPPVATPEPSPAISGDIEARNLGFYYQSPAQPVLNDLSFRIAQNSLVAVIGTTGAGKSTLIDILIGLLQPKNGTLSVGNNELTTFNIPAWQRSIGYVPQKIYLLEDSLEKNIAFGQNQNEINPARVAECARLTHIDSFIESLPAQYETSVGEHGDRLSGGQRQRVGIARALYRNPDVLVLDEPTSALDPQTAQNLMMTLKELSADKTVIVITHSQELLRYCDQVLHLQNGQLAESTSPA